jgi:predicted Zn-dependent protease with MMP-like domain
VNHRRFEACVEEGLASIPVEFRDRLENIAIVIEDEPTPEQRAYAGLEDDETLLGLYEGVSLDRRDSGYAGVMPDRITIFRKPILEEARTPEEIPDIVRDTVWHEIAHYFGMDEDEVQAAEQEREERKKRD